MIGIQRAITRTFGIAGRTPGSSRGLRRRAFAGAAGAAALAIVGGAAAAAGDLDTTFGRGGVSVTSVGKNPVFGAGALQPDGKYVVAGTVQGRDGRDVLVVRYGTDGKLDPSFGKRGKAILDFGGDETANDIVVEPDGKIAIAGSAASYYGTSDFALYRLNADGSVDTGFGTSGVVRRNVGVNDDGAHAIALRAGGYVLAGAKRVPLNDVMLVPRTAVVAFTTTGAHDWTYADDGPYAYGHSSSAVDAFVDAVGRIVVGGTASGSAAGATSGDLYVLRLLPDGSPDISFGSGGWRQTNVGSDAIIGSWNDRIAAIAPAPDGGVVAVGSSNLHPLIARYDEAGNAPAVTVQAAMGSFDAIASRTATDFLVAGSVFTTPDGPSDFSIGSYNADGVASGFAPVTTDIGGDDRARDVALLPDGKVLVGGTTEGRTTAFALVRYLG